jgi:coniferyl-aldehyde dehydrogenase
MTDLQDSGVAASERVHSLFAAQQARPTSCSRLPSASQRRARLLTLKRQVQRYQDRLADAMSNDFGHRAAAESKMLDLLGSVLELSHAASHVRRWMRTRRRSTELLFLTNSVKVMYQPKGVVGVIVPWNFPIYLALGPLTAALAAGNRVMIKMPEVTPATNAVLKALLAEVFERPGRRGRRGAARPQRLHVAAVQPHRLHRLAGGRQDRHAHRGRQPDAGDAGARRQVAGAGARGTIRRPTPPTRITHGKSVNCGQICVSPDYALVPRERVDEFIAGVRATFQRFYDGRTDGNRLHRRGPRPPHQRVLAMLDDARAKGARSRPARRPAPAARCRCTSSPA